MWVALSALVALACVAASVRRLSWAVAPIAIDPVQIGQALGRGPEAVSAVRAALESVKEGEDLSWERDFFAALDTPESDERSGLLNEQLLDLEWRAARWARVPRVCASICTSSGFLFATMALIGGLSQAPLPDVAAAVSPALDAFSVSIAGAAFCIAVHVRVRRAVREWLSAADRLVVASTPPAAARVM
jgi:hypothetical protein